MEYSSGIIPYRVNKLGKLEFFVGHPTGSGNYWAFLKGRMEEGENYVTTAIREFQEESGLPIFKGKTLGIDFHLIDLGEVKQRKGKIVHAFGYECLNISPIDCHSNFVEGTTKPEVDKYQWMTLEELKETTHPKHIQFYETIIEKKGGN